MMAGVVSGYVMWAQDVGLPVTLGRLTNEETIDRYVGVMLGDLGYATATRMGAHSQLRRVAIANNPGAPAAGRAFCAALPQSRPYPESQISDLHACSLTLLRCPTANATQRCASPDRASPAAQAQPPARVIARLRANGPHRPSRCSFRTLPAPARSVAGPVPMLA